jgi:DNA-binding MarR family transcriptional regulator
MRFSLDSHIVDTLMRDLVSHDRAPSAFLLYLFLWRQTRGAERDSFGASLQEMATDTGLSKSTVQNALRRLKRRGLVSARKTAPTSACYYQVHEPWRRGGR